MLAEAQGKKRRWAILLITSFEWHPDKLESPALAKEKL